VSRNSKHPDTISARADGFVDAQSGGVVPPMQASTTFIRDGDYNLSNPENTYGRDHNEQVRLAEQILSKLEGASDSLLFASGMAAIAALIEPLKSGQTLLVQEGCYWGATAFFRDHCAHRNINLIEADSGDLDAFTKVIVDEQPDLVFLETPSNPWIRLCDVIEISKVTKKHGALLAVDATAATPILMQPLGLGADIVMHSATKAINGHTDVLAGVVSVRDHHSDYWASIAKCRHMSGAIVSAHSAWMLIRGMRTLPLRIERMCKNALAVAEFLSTHEKVEAVWYPGLTSDPGHALAQNQMSGGFGYLMSFLVRGKRHEALEFCRHLEGIHRATSLGGTESLVEHRHTIEGDLTGCPENLIRLSIGIENKKDLIEELDQALSKI
jgi:cystathionine gamma-synthase